MAGLARPGIARFLARRLAQAVPTVLLIVVVNFLVLHLTPGDIVDVLAGEAGAATPEYVAMLRERFGLDRPVALQLASYVGGMARLDLGFSFRHNTTVARLIVDRLPATLLLMTVSIALAVGLGVLLGAVAARHVNRPADAVIGVLALLAYATPTFWIGLMFIVLFSVKLGWLPTGGMMTVGPTMSGLDRLLDVARHLILPSVSLALFYAAIYTRLMRASMLEVYGQEYVRTAHAKGLGEAAVTYRHVLRNALLPVVTVAGVQVGSLLGGSVLVESVFGWPGLGRLAFESVQQRDFNLLLGILFMSSLLVIAVNLAVDLLYAVLDPRIELA
ncbi:MAG: ABC transporter permease [Candidatus Rokubacteria bacterium]|nr:ABC transporter permease [Candidatus Rokubacteria bacterium]